MDKYNRIMDDVVLFAIREWHEDFSTEAYPHNPNGSSNAIAGLCDPSGRCFGLMPHPEAYLFPENHPHWDLDRWRGDPPSQGLGLRIFRNAVDHLNQS